jgi:beta-lactamase regulating signal transducer with metallopeptidase domain
MSAAASIIILVSFAVKPLVKNRLSKSFQYYVWLVVLVLLLVPIPIDLPATAPVDTALNQAANQGFVTIRDTVDRYVVTTNELIARTKVEEAAQSQAITQNAELDSPLSRWLNAAVIVWPLGAAIFLLVHIIGYLRFRRRLSEKNRAAREKEKAMLWRLCPKRSPLLYRNPAAVTPMLIGVFRPTIVLPDRECDDTQLENILLHELTHLRRGDIAFKWLTMFAGALHWFNPLVYFARREISRACELACDEAVIGRLDRDGKQSYGDTLISVIAESRTPIGVLSTTMCEEKETLKERLESIMKYKSKSEKVIAISVIFLLVLIISASALCVSFGANIDKYRQGMHADKVSNQLLYSLGYSKSALGAIGDNRTPYVGDNSKVGAIINQLPVPWKGLVPDGFSLQTSAEPYSLTINYSAPENAEITDYLENPFAASIQENNALLLFSSIDNLPVVNNNNPDDMPQYSCTREQIQSIYGEIPSIKDVDKILTLLGRNLRPEEFYFSHASRIYLGTSPDESEYRYGEPPTIVKLDSGLVLYKYAGYPDTLYYYKGGQLYAKRELAPDQVSYGDIIQRFGPPQNEKTVEGKQVISYELRKSERDQMQPPLNDRRAFFVFKDKELVEEGLMVGDRYALLVDGN